MESTPTALPCPRPAAAGRPWRDRGGMTLVEVMITTMLLTFVIATSLTVLSFAYRTMQHARLVAQAGQIAQSVMEQFRLSNYTTLKTRIGQTETSLATELASENLPASLTQGFTVTGTFASLPTTASIGKMSVTVTVTWSERNVQFTRSLVTYFSEKGLSDYLYVGW